MVVTQGTADAQKKIAAYKQRKLARQTLNTTGQTKQQVLDSFVKAGQAQVDKNGQISMNGKILGNTSEFSGNDLANTYNQTTGKFEAPSTTPQNGTEGTIQPENIGTPEDTTTPTSSETQSLTGPQEKPQETLTNNQNVVGGNIGGMNVSQQQTKQQVLDKAISSGQASVDTAGNIISKSGKNLGNINQIDLTQSAIGQTAPNSNEPIQQQAQANTQNKNKEQIQVDSIAPDVSLGLSNSPDSPFWNTFGQAAIDNENQLPGYMNERNKIIASSVMLNNPSMKYMSEAKRKDMILRDIIDRQEGGIDPAIESRYSKTIDNINNLINRSIPAYTANDYFGMMLDGSSKDIDYDAVQGNPMYNSAKSRFNNLNTYSSMDVSGLSDAIKTGKLNKGGQLWNDLLNKGMGESLEKAYSMYNMQQEAVVYDYVSGEVTSFDSNKSLESQGSIKIDLGTGLEAQVSEKILSLMTNPDDAPTLGSFLLNDADVQKAKTASRKTEAEINDLSDQIKQFSDDIKTKVVERGGEATDDPFLESYITEKTKPFTRKLMALNGKYRNEIALLEDVTETATTAFEVQQYNKNMQIQGYQFVLGRLDAQEAKKTAKEAADLAQSNREKSFQFQQDQSKVSQSQRQQTFNLQKQQATQSQANWDKTYNAANPTAPGTVTGKVVPVTFGGKNFYADEGMATALSNVEQQLNAAGINRDTGAQNYRTKEEQEALKKAGKSWTMNSNHMKGLAVDMYTNNGKSSALLKPTPEMIKIMNANGFYQDPELMKKGDYGHFDYKGVQTNAGDISIDKIISFNDDVTRRKMSSAEIAAIGNAKKTIMSDPNADISDIMAWSNGGKAIGDTQSKTLLKFDQAMGQLEGISTQIKNMKTGPIIGTLRSMNPYDTNANVLKAQLQGLVPTIARGIYGEVGVLTDNDIRLYAKTLPTLKGTDAINKGVLAVTLDILAGGYKKQLAGLAGQGYDVSGLEGVYQNIKGQADTIRQQLGIPTSDNSYIYSSPVANTTQSTLLSNPYSRRKK